MIIGIVMYLIIGCFFGWYAFDEEYERPPDHPLWIDMAMLVLFWPLIIGIATYKVIFGNWEDI